MVSIDIINIEIIQARSAKIKEKFESYSCDPRYMEEFLLALSKTCEWKYSTGPIFDEPPYQMELMGFSSGRLLKKKYKDFFEARLLGAYSSGFASDRHLVTVSPSKPQNTPVNASRFNQENGETHIAYAYHYVDSKFNVLKPPKLNGLGEIFDLGNKTTAFIVVGRNDAESIYLYCHDDHGLIRSVHLWTKGVQVQSNYDFHYDDGILTTIKSGESLIWMSKKA